MTNISTEISNAIQQTTTSIVQQLEATKKELVSLDQQNKKFYAQEGETSAHSRIRKSIQ
jgi:hypothetical protein